MPTLASHLGVGLILIAAAGSLGCGERHTLPSEASQFALSVAEIQPARGPASGGTSLSIMGSGFQTGTRVTFGGTAATSLVVTSRSLMTAVAPAHAAGTVDVVVTNPDGRNVLAGRYLYFLPENDPCAGCWDY